MIWVRCHHSLFKKILPKRFRPSLVISHVPFLKCHKPPSLSQDGPSASGGSLPDAQARNIRTSLKCTMGFPPKKKHILKSCMHCSLLLACGVSIIEIIFLAKADDGPQSCGADLARFSASLLYMIFTYDILLARQLLNYIF